MNVAIDLYEAHPGPKLLLTYEGLRENPLQGYSALLSFVDNLPVDQSILSQAVGDSEFGKMQRQELIISSSSNAEQAGRIGVPGWRGDMNALKVRRGLVGGFYSDFGVPAAVLLTLMPSVMRLLFRIRRLVKLHPPMCNASQAAIPFPEHA